MTNPPDSRESLISQRDLLVQQLDEARRTFERAVADLSLTKRITEALRYATDVRRVCRVIIDTILAEMRAENCSLMLLDAEAGSLYIKAARSQTDPGTYYHAPADSKRSFLLGEGIAGGVAATRESILIADTQNDRRFVAEAETQDTIRSILCLPLINQEVLVGVINLSHPESNAFTEQDRRTMTMITDQVAIALQNVQLMEELQYANVALKNEIRRSEDQAAMVTRAYDELQIAHNDLKRMQDHLIQTEKLRALGEMVAGVAHNFNNILTSVSAYAQMMRLRQGLPAVVTRQLKAMDQQVQSGISLVRRMQDFAQGRSSPFTEVDLNRVVLDTIEITRPKWKHAAAEQGVRIEVKTDLLDLPRIEASEAQLGEVLTNIIFNAVDAMPAGGTITVRTYSTEGDGWVAVEVEDTGTGMSDDVRHRVFEPFFTTKAPDKGTGLGLSTAYGIISQHHGDMKVESLEDRGTIFTTRLPVRQPRIAAQEDKAPERFLAPR